MLQRRWIVMMVVALGVSSMVAGCSKPTSGSAKPLTSGKPFTLGVSLALNNTDFWTSYIKFQAQDAKAQHVNLLSPVIANNDSGKQISDIQSLISEGAQVLIVNPVDSQAIKPALDDAASHHIPVVAVDVAPAAGSVYMIVRANNTLYGQEACSYISSHVTSGTVLQLEGDLSSLNGRDRTAAFNDCMKQKAPQLKVVSDPTKWEAPTATTDAQDALHTYPDLKAIYVQWSGPVPGILQAEHSQNRFTPVGAAGHVILVSDDGVPFEMQDIRSGSLDSTVSQPATLYAQYAVSYSRDALAGKKFAAGQPTDHQTKLVTVDGNLEDPINAPLVTPANVKDPSLWGNQAG